MAIADHYHDLLDGLIVDVADESQSGSLGVATLVTRTSMDGDADRERLAREVLAFAAELGTEASRAP